MISHTEMNNRVRGELYRICRGETFPIIPKIKMYITREPEEITPKLNPEKIIQEYDNMSKTALIICIIFVELMMFPLLKWKFRNDNIQE